MNDIPFVQIIQALENLTDKILYERLLESSVIAQKCRDRAAGNILEENVQVVVVKRRVCMI